MEKNYLGAQGVVVVETQLLSEGTLSAYQLRGLGGLATCLALSLKSRLFRTLSPEWILSCATSTVAHSLVFLSLANKLIEQRCEERDPHGREAGDGISQPL